MPFNEPKHPYVMVGAILLMCIAAGAIFGYMAVNVPEFPPLPGITLPEPPGDVNSVLSFMAILPVLIMVLLIATTLLYVRDGI